MGCVFYSGSLVGFEKVNAEALEQLKAAGSAVPFNCLHAAAAAPKKRALEFMLAHGGVDVNHRDTAVRTCLAGDCCRVECVALTACMLPRATHHCTTLQ